MRRAPPSRPRVLDAAVLRAAALLREQLVAMRLDALPLHRDVLPPRARARGAVAGTAGTAPTRCARSRAPRRGGGDKPSPWAPEAGASRSEVPPRAVRFGGVAVRPDDGWRTAVDRRTTSGSPLVVRSVARRPASITGRRSVVACRSSVVGRLGAGSGRAPMRVCVRTRVFQEAWVAWSCSRRRSPPPTRASPWRRSRAIPGTFYGVAGAPPQAPFGRRPGWGRSALRARRRSRGFARVWRRSRAFPGREG